MAFKLTRTLLIGSALGAGLVSAREARAFQTEIDATLDAQFYSLASPYGSPLVQVALAARCRFRAASGGTQPRFGLLHPGLGRGAGRCDVCLSGGTALPG